MRRNFAPGATVGGHAKEALFEAIEAELGPKRELYEAIRADEKKLDETLEDGAERARKVAGETMNRVRSAIGITR